MNFFLLFFLVTNFFGLMASSKSTKNILSQAAVSDLPEKVLTIEEKKGFLQVAALRAVTGLPEVHKKSKSRERINEKMMLANFCMDTLIQISDEAQRDRLVQYKKENSNLQNGWRAIFCCCQSTCIESTVDKYLNLARVRVDAQLDELNRQIRKSEDALSSWV